MSPTFRAGVGIVVFDARGRVLALERSAVPGGWQLPQGGIEGDEQPVDALWRELREETGLTADDVQVLAEVPEWLGYELPAEYRSGPAGTTCPCARMRCPALSSAPGAGSIWRSLPSRRSPSASPSIGVWLS